MVQFMNSLYNICNTISPAIYLLVAAALIITGIMFIVPSQKTKQAAKEHLPFIVIGCGVVLGALTLANEISKNFVF